jgi:hypothetical protein
VLLILELLIASNKAFTPSGIVAIDNKASLLPLVPGSALAKSA